VLKFRNNETKKELRPFTPQCKCGFAWKKVFLLTENTIRLRYKNLIFASDSRKADTSQSVTQTTG